MLSVDAHPGLHLAAFTTTFPRPLGQMDVPSWLEDALSSEADIPLQRSDELRLAVRDMLRHGGYKPTGRGKPASEYLVRAAGEGKLGSINCAVDPCNVVSLHSGLPISVVDLDRASPPFRIAIADTNASYVFNSAGQEIRIGGLLCVHDKDGPCANAVKDAQRTKTDETTVRTVSVVWGVRGFEDGTVAAVAAYRGLLERLGASVETVR